MTTEVHYITDTSKIEDEALDWLMILDREDSLSTEQLSKLKSWLSISPAHGEALTQFNQFWSNQVLTDLHVSLSAPQKKRKIQAWQYALASCCVFIFTFFLFVQPATNTFPISNQVLTSVIGEQQEHVLADGSTIHLNSNSKLAVSYDNDFRNLHLLKGKAHFKVVKETRPFRVYAAGGRVEAIGTAFTVEVEDDALAVLVTEGVVALASQPEKDNLDSATIFSSDLTTLGAVNAGNKALIHTHLPVESLSTSFNNLIKPVTQRELSKVESWLNGSLVFFGEPLGQVINEIAAFTSLQIDIADPELAELSIGGRFEANDLDQFFRLLEASFSIKVVKVNDKKIIITKTLITDGSGE